MRKVAYIRNSKDYLSDELYELEKELNAQATRKQPSAPENSNNHTITTTTNNNSSNKER